MYVVDAKARAVVAVVEAASRPRAWASPTGSGSRSRSRLNGVPSSTPRRSRRDVKVGGKNRSTPPSPDGRWIYVSAGEGSSVDVIDVAKARWLPDPGRQASARHRLSRTGSARCRLRGGATLTPSTPRREVGRSVKVGVVASGVALHRTASASCDRRKSAAVGSSTWLRTTSPRSWPASGRGHGLTPDGKKLYVANGRSGSVSVIDTAALKKLADVPVGELPWGVAIPR
jgi:YVTN family beta-propeller protein